MEGTGTLTEQLRAAEQALDALRRAGQAGDVASAGAASADLAASVGRLQAGLVGEIRGRGWSWAQVGEALGMSRQAAHERFRHIPTPAHRQDHLTLVREAAAEATAGSEAPADAVAPTQPPPAPEADALPTQAQEPPTEPHNGPGDGGVGPAPRAPRRQRQRRSPRPTVADFATDPVYGLERLSDGVYVVTEHGRRIGTVVRRRSRTGRSATWEAWTDEPYTRVGDRAHGSRAQAGLAVIDARVRGQGRTGTT